MTSVCSGWSVCLEPTLSPGHYRGKKGRWSRALLRAAARWCRSWKSCPSGRLRGAEKHGSRRRSKSRGMRVLFPTEYWQVVTWEAMDFLGGHLWTHHSQHYLSAGTRRTDKVHMPHIPLVGPHFSSPSSCRKVENLTIPCRVITKSVSCGDLSASSRSPVVKKSLSFSSCFLIPQKSVFNRPSGLKVLTGASCWGGAW